ncbi:MAG: hypothetical protein HQ562_05490 [Candidatus Marinimicrobia bacterium]|nr:hypothetical protein [Candidatus Neomarinimicrobiota bacterium]
MNFKTVRLIASGLLLIALLDLPYGYYTLLRIIICILAGYTAYVAYESEKIPWVWIFGLIAILFNPVIPIYLDRETWAVIDIIVALVFAVSITQIKSIE